MFYRIIALFALFFFTACGGGGGEGGGTGDGGMSPQTSRKSANMEFSATQQAPSGAGLSATPAEDLGQGGEVPLKIVKIGLLVPMSGDAAEVGTALQDAATLALMDKFGMMQNEYMRVKVVLVPRDTKGTPAGAIDAARHVLNAGAQMIVGPLFAQEVSAVAPIAKEYGVSVLTFSNNPDVAGDGVYVFGFQVEQQVQRVVNYALNQNLTGIALMAPQTAYGSAVQQSAAEVMGRSNLNLVSEQMYQPVASGGDEVSKLVRVREDGGKLQAILLPEGGEKLSMLARALKERSLGMPNVRLLGTGLWDDPAVLRSGELAGGWFASSSPERFAAYERRFRDNFGYAPPRISALAYDAMALSSALAMSTSGENFSADAITDGVGYNGPVNGIFRCLPSGVCERGLAVMEVTANGAKIIDAPPSSF